jgi:cyclopropane fatty-acyl-phospholipid synthase-like methyltransferase
MAAVYSTGTMSKIVAAGGQDAFMNLGYASGVIARETTRVRQLRMVERVLALLAPAPGERIVDVGCGKGGTLLALRGRTAEVRCLGVNIDSLQLATARHVAGRTAATPLQLVQANAAELPFRRSSCDKVYAIELLSHVARKEKFVDGVAHMLRPGGRVVLAFITLAREVQDFSPSEQENLRSVGAFFREEPESIPTFAAIAKLFEAAGFMLESHEDATDRVLPPRYEEFVSILREIDSPWPWRRAAVAARARFQWRLRISELEPFLRANTMRHPCRDYEYHLAAWRKGAS